MRKKKIKISKKNYLFILIIFIILGLGYYYYTNFYQKDDEKDSIVTDELSIHFLETGNQYTGDAIYIKAGENDILIDAGSRNSSAGYIADYIDEYVTDNKLEYVIATHAHQDHIAGFVGTSSVLGIFDRYETGIIIDFALSDSTSAVYQNYCNKRDAEVEAGAKHYTALECCLEQNGAQKEYLLSDDIKLTILYNYYYDHKTSDENNYSVCLLITQGDKNYLLTGDLEKAGEEKLIANNDIPQVDLYKANHHGSYTASSAEFLAVIKPKNIVVCCVCGSTEYTDNIDNVFPAQDFITRVAKYTDQIYVTSIISADGTESESMNGNIVVKSNGVNLSITGSNNSTIFKETAWFKEHRTLPN